MAGWVHHVRAPSDDGNRRARRLQRSDMGRSINTSGKSTHHHDTPLREPTAEHPGELATPRARIPCTDHRDRQPGKSDPPLPTPDHEELLRGIIDVTQGPGILRRSGEDRSAGGCLGLLAVHQGTPRSRDTTQPSRSALRPPSSAANLHPFPDTTHSTPMPRLEL